MSLTSPISRTSVEQKRKTQEAAREKRYGTPKLLRDMLREKCRIRIRSARQSLYEKYRNIEADSEDKKPLIEEILREEVAELEHDVELQEEIYKELIDEANEWFAEQWEQEESYLIGVADILTCPVCQQSALEEHAALKTFICKCSANFYYSGSKGDLAKILQTKIDEHEQYACSNPLLFFLEPGANAETLEKQNKLNAMCENCDYFCSF